MSKNSKLNHVSEHICIKKNTTLGRIPDTEQWLNRMSEQGFTLLKIEGRTFHFIQEEAEPASYFMLSPEKGANSSAWIYYEFLEKGGRRIPHHGISHLSPNLVLKIPNHTFQKNPDLYRYYFQHRNYRLFRRLVSNIVLSIIITFSSVVFICIDFPDLISLFFLCPVGLAIGIPNVISLCRLLASCKQQGIPATWKRPRRPGY